LKKRKGREEEIESQNIHMKWWGRLVRELGPHSHVLLADAPRRFCAALPDTLVNKIPLDAQSTFNSTTSTTYITNIREGTRNWRIA
jgi:hypothetical protein